MTKRTQLWTSYRVDGQSWKFLQSFQNSADRFAPRMNEVQSDKRITRSWSGRSIECQAPWLYRTRAIVGLLKGPTWRAAEALRPVIDRRSSVTGSSSSSHRLLPHWYESLSDWTNTSFTWPPWRQWRAYPTGLYSPTQCVWRTNAIVLLLDGPYVGPCDLQVLGSWLQHEIKTWCVLWLAAVGNWQVHGLQKRNADAHAWKGNQYLVG